jgi:1-deoxy-D-xylulose-5-phosphate reductoisomerase
MSNKIKRIAVLGSTGSIGRQTLDIVRSLPDHFNVVGLATGGNLELLTEQVAEFNPDYISFASPNHDGNKQGNFKKIGCEFVPLEDMAALPGVDIVVIAVSGAAGLAATLKAARAGKTIALANKESLVSAGAIITSLARKSFAKIFPVDSEHSAIWQCLAGEKTPPRRIILTASGGPFRHYPEEQMKDITPEQALAHPSWRMGKKVTIDSATLMNKGLEVIEARWLFNVAVEDVNIIVHPQSIVHSMVEFIDGSVKAQIGVPDMRLPIQLALTYPDRVENPDLPHIKWNEFPNLVFEQPDIGKFPCLRLAIEAGKNGGTYPAVLCGADEVAVDLFLNRRIRFTDIARLVEQALDKHVNNPHPALEDITGADKWVREMVLDLTERNK